MQEELTEKEREQMRRFVSLQKIVLTIFMKWLPVFALFFALVFAVFSAYIVYRSAKSGHRFEAVTQLVYNPRQMPRVQNISEKQLMSILDRASIKRKVGERLPMDLSERECLTIDLEVEQQKRPTNLFILTARAPTWKGAVKKVNMYAKLLVEGYEEYRREDLDSLGQSLAKRKRDMQTQVAELESMEHVLQGKAGVATPAETLTLLTALLSDQRKNLSMLSVQLANEEARKKKLSSVAGPFGKAIADNIARVRQLVASVQEIKKDLADLEKRFTSEHMAVTGKTEELKSRQEELATFLRSCGIGEFDLNTIDVVEKASRELAEVEMQIDVLNGHKKALETEIAESEKRSEQLTSFIPEFDRLRVRRMDLEQSLRDLDDQLDNIDYLKMYALNDLRQIEHAGGAGDNSPFRIKNFIISGAGATIATLVLAAWTLMLELLFGKVSGAREMRSYDDVHILGVLPKEGAMDAQEERDVHGVVALKFSDSGVPMSKILSCRLDGAEVGEKFKEALAWSLTMSGERIFTLEIVPSATFQPPEGAETMLATARKGDRGWFPVDNRFTLAPTELQMLMADLATLAGEYDHVIFYPAGGMRRGGSFFDQLLGICDSVMLVVGAGATRRRSLAYALKHIRLSAKPVTALVVNAGVKAARKEMEAKG